MMFEAVGFFDKWTYTNLEDSNFQWKIFSFLKFVRGDSIVSCCLLLDVGLSISSAEMNVKLFCARN